MAENHVQSGLADQFRTLHEFVKAAKIRLSPDKWDYMLGAAETETTLKRNRQAIDMLGFRARVLRDVADIDCSGKIFGKKTRLPVMIAPVGGLERFDAGGAATVAKAAAQFGVPQMVSSVSRPGLEPTAEAAAGRKFFQLYVRGDLAWVDAYIERAVAAGYEAFCFTVDTAYYGRRERDIAKRVVMRSDTDAAGERFQAALSWNHVKRFKEKCKLPLILKGIQTAEDAVIACDHGVDGIYVTNHGGRQLDHGRGTIEILPEVVAAARGKAEIIIDSGFYRGTDIIKGIALGAHSVAIGRLYLYGLAAAGQAGVVRVLELLESEIRINLGLLGVTSFAELDPACLMRVERVREANVHSAFPLLNLADEGYGGR